MRLAIVSRLWNRFFFKPVSPQPIALFRIVYGVLVLALNGLIAPDLLVWYGDRGIMPRQIALRIHPPDSINLMQRLPHGDGWVIAFFCAFMVAAFCLTIGLFTRTMAALVFLGFASMHHRNPLILNSGDTFFRLTAFALMFSHAGAAFSVDRLWRVARGKETAAVIARAPWAQRVIQLQLAIGYFATFAWKAKGAAWVHGYATYFTARVTDFQRFPLPWVFDHTATIRFVTWSTLVVELALGTLIWFRELRYWVILAGIGLHLGIEWTMNIPLFEWIMMAMFITYVEPEDLSKVVARMRARLVRPRLVFAYAGGCTVCTRDANLLRAADVLHFIDVVDLDAPATATDWPELCATRAGRTRIVRSPDGKELTGLAAAREISRRVPALWPFAAAASVPGLAQIAWWVALGLLGQRARVMGARCEHARLSAESAPQAAAA